MDYLHIRDEKGDLLWKGKLLVSSKRKGIEQELPEI